MASVFGLSCGDVKPQRCRGCASLPRVAALSSLVPEGMTLPELALRFILENPVVTTTIPGMRKLRHVDANLGASDGERLPARLLQALRAHRWDRTPAGVP